MFFYILFSVAAFPPDNDFTNLSEDPITGDHIRLEMPYNLQAKNTEIENFIYLFFSLGTKENMDGLIRIASFYSSELKKYTIKEIHPFLTHFTTFICSIVYLKKNYGGFEKFRPDFLFNLISFGKFIEMYKTNEATKMAITDLFGNSLDNYIDLKSVEIRDWGSPPINHMYNAIKDMFRHFFPGLHQKNAHVKHFVYMLNFRKLQYSLSRGTFEFFLCFFYSLVRFKAFEGEYTENCSVKYMLPSRKTVEKIKEDVAKLSRLTHNNNNNPEYKNILGYIFKPFSKNILKKETGFFELFDHSENFSLNNKLEDSKFSQDFVEVFCNEEELNKIKCLNKFIKEKTKEEYHDYISAVICLEAFNLKRNFSEGNDITRIIMDILFLTDVLKTKFEEIKTAENRREFRKIFFEALIKELGKRGIKLSPDTEFDFLNVIKLPRTSSLLEMYYFAELLYGNIARRNFSCSLQEKLNQKLNTKEKDSDFTKTNYLLYVFNNEISGLTQEELKNLFSAQTPETPVSKTTNSKNFGFDKIFFYIVLPILCFCLIIIGAYWYIYMMK
ncbi:hypothetical protein CWI38_0253p0010 [Hamiltosporidium tvaerminnensis]|uniref:Uncharacterized protein n=1 Tax=Hamiltosporidium tvaerminnensis TaxID=1176355 RepID=A0A4Q9LZ07_9MICR|nr:hypothetical protein CWI38_0253p0010 [Hamiltosporidium tvaerminnensis]